MMGEGWGGKRKGCEVVRRGRKELQLAMGEGSRKGCGVVEWGPGGAMEGLRRIVERAAE